MYEAPIEATEDKIRVGTEVRPKNYFHHEVYNVTGTGLDLKYEWISTPWTDAEVERYSKRKRKLERGNILRKLTLREPKTIPDPYTAYFHDINIGTAVVTVWDTPYSRYDS